MHCSRLMTNNKKFTYLLTRYLLNFNKSSKTVHQSGEWQIGCYHIWYMAKLGWRGGWGKRSVRSRTTAEASSSGGPGLYKLDILAGPVTRLDLAPQDIWPLWSFANTFGRKFIPFGVRSEVMKSSNSVINCELKMGEFTANLLRCIWWFA